ncbi:hypothetical protein TL16_g00518 [Triparma laevis f. inornata]|uniref:Uncharacterized protein n=1 Tax=Triparma laevis f. inornata TaxID=1714386 RepID=A0A9W6ZBX5_9STRA|nr:hypothetical protein TL16_g00518 [Triparma laevis f. inornata]
MLLQHSIITGYFCLMIPARWDEETTKKAASLIYYRHNLCMLLHPFSVLYTIVLFCSDPLGAHQVTPRLSVGFLAVQMIVAIASAPFQVYVNGYITHGVLYLMAGRFAIVKLRSAKQASKSKLANWVHTRVPSLAMAGLVNISYFSAPMLGCIIENYADEADKDEEQVLCEDVGLSTAPVTMLICCAVFTLAFEMIPSSDPNAQPYGKTNFHRFDMSLVHQILVSLFFGTALLNCWTYASMREMPDMDAFIEWKDDKHWSGREARLWYNILLRCLMAIALILPFLASTVGEYVGGRSTAITDFTMRVRAFGMTQKPFELGPIFRYISVFMLLVFFAIQAAYWYVIYGEAAENQGQKRKQIKIGNTFTLLLSPIVFMTSIFCYLSRPRSSSKKLTSAIFMPLIYSVAATALTMHASSELEFLGNAKYKLAGASSSSIFFISTFGGIGLAAMARNSLLYLRTFTDQLLGSYLSGFTSAMLPVVFVSTYLCFEAVACVEQSKGDRCQPFVISQYVVLVNTSCSYVYFCMFGFINELKWRDVFLMDDPSIEPWKVLQIFVQLATTFFASVAFGLRPDKKLLSSGLDDEDVDKYVSGTFISNIIIGMFVWVIVSLWVVCILCTGAHLRILREDEDLDNDDEDEEGGVEPFILRLSRWSVNKISFLKRVLTNPKGTLSMSILYRCCFGVMPVTQFGVSFFTIVFHYVSYWTTSIDKKAGMFCLLLSEQLLPFAWAGSVLFVFSSYETVTFTRAEKLMIFFPFASSVLNMMYFVVQGKIPSSLIWVVVVGANAFWSVAVVRAKGQTNKRSEATKLNHLINTGAASSSLIPAMMLVGSQSVACLVTDFAAGRPGYAPLQYESNCDSVFNANKGMLLIFTYCIFQYACFNVDKRFSMAVLVRLQITRMQVLQFICFSTTFTIALFLYSCGGGFGEHTQTYRKVLQAFLILIVIIATSIQIIDTLIAKIKLFHNHSLEGEDLTVGGDDVDIRGSMAPNKEEEKKTKTKAINRRISFMFRKKQKKKVGVGRMSSTHAEEEGERIQTAVEMINPGYL